MGKNLIQQARGKGSPRYRSPSFRWKTRAMHKHPSQEILKGIVTDIVKCQGHSAPLYKISWPDGQKTISICPEGIRVGDAVQLGTVNNPDIGNTSPLGSLPEGTLIFNIESQPGDGGKFVRSTGTFARIVSKMPGKVTVLLPSKRTKTFSEGCRATIGIVAGSGRTEKPFLKAGTKHHAMKARNKLYPHISGTSQNSVDHPFGGSSSGHKGRPTIAPKNAPPGRKVGKIRPHITGKRK